MAFREIYVPNDPYLTYKDTTIYHVYPDNDYEQGPRKYSFSPRPDGLEDDIDTFDVRDMDPTCCTWEISERKIKLVLQDMINKGMISDLLDEYHAVKKEGTY